LQKVDVFVLLRIAALQQPPAIIHAISTDVTAMAMFRISLFIDPILVAEQNHIAG